jgi:hypothetical protein
MLWYGSDMGIKTAPACSPESRNSPPGSDNMIIEEFLAAK